MKEQMKILKEQGITLVALVVTIIILLILAGVTLNIALSENGIFNKTKQAVEKYEESQNKELNDIEKLSDKLSEIMQEKINIKLSKENLIMDREDKEVLVATIMPEKDENKKVKWKSSNEDVAEVSEEGEVTAKTVGKTTIEAFLEDDNKTSAICKVTVINPTIAKKAKFGSYIKYEVPEKEFTMTPEQTGQDENQEYNTSTYEGLWRVLYNDEEHGLQIISDDIVGKLTLGHVDSDGNQYIRNEEDEKKAKIAYNKIVSTLNTFSRYYVNPKYAISGRSVGSNPITPDDNETKTEKLIKSDYPKGSDNWDSGCILFNDYNTTTKYDRDLMSSLNNETNAEDTFWFASRLGYCNEYGARFSTDYGKKDGSLYSCNFWAMGDGELNGIISSNPGEFTHGVKPVITINPNVQTQSGNGEESTPFILVDM